MLGIALSVVFEASECAREARATQLLTQLENVAEDLIQLHREFLELPPQSSTALASCEEDVPF
jgi:hypothetical protein